jgi:hypothetical protein
VQVKQTLLRGRKGRSTPGVTDTTFFDTFFSVLSVAYKIPRAHNLNTRSTEKATQVVKKGYT